MSYLNVRHSVSHNTYSNSKYFIIVKICFNRELHFCLEQKHPEILGSPEGQDVVKMYNQTALALVEFECVLHKAWVDEVSKLDYGWFLTLDNLICCLP